MQLVLPQSEFFGHFDEYNHNLADEERESQSSKPADLNSAA